MTVANTAVTLFCSAAFSVALLNKADADPFQVENLGSVETLYLCGFNHNLNLRHTCNFEGFQGVGRVYNDLDSLILSEGGDRTEELWEDLQNGCGVQLAQVGFMIEAAHKVAGIYPSSVTGATREALMSVVNDQCLSTFGAISAEIGVDPEVEFGLNDMRDFFQPGIVR